MKSCGITQIDTFLAKSRSLPQRKAAGRAGGASTSPMAATGRLIPKRRPSRSNTECLPRRGLTAPRRRWRMQGRCEFKQSRGGPSRSRPGIGIAARRQKWRAKRAGRGFRQCKPLSPLRGTSPGGGSKQGIRTWVPLRRSLFHFYYCALFPRGRGKPLPCRRRRGRRRMQRSRRGRGNCADPRDLSLLFTMHCFFARVT